MPSSSNQHALDFDHRDVFAAAAHDVLLAVDEKQRRPSPCVDNIASMEPAAVPGLVGGGFVFQVLEKKPRRGHRDHVPHQQFAGLAAHSHPRRHRRRCDNPSVPRAPMQRCPTWRGPPAVEVTAPAPVSVIAQASISGKPKRCSKSCLMTRIDTGAETKTYACARSARFLIELQQDRRHHAEIVDTVAPEFLTVRHQRCAWKRSSGTLRRP